MSFWAVVRSQPKREAFASDRLLDAGFETFLPLIEKRRASQPLFPSYLFVLIVDRWRSINFTFGVLNVVKTGDCPARCPDHEIANLKAMIDGNGFVRLPDQPSRSQRVFKKGDAVKVAGGPLVGFHGIYAGQSTRQRELVLLNILGAQTPVTIAAGSLVPA
jgi:transcription antitermination factor NusG